MPVDLAAFRNLVSVHGSPKNRVTRVTGVTVNKNNDLDCHTVRAERVTCVTGNEVGGVGHAALVTRVTGAVTEEAETNQQVSRSGHAVTRSRTKTIDEAEIIGQAEATPSRDCAEWFARFEERAAIREYEGGFDRAEAERLAREDLAEEFPDRPNGGACD